jgi:hypothetical protein
MSLHSTLSSPFSLLCSKDTIKNTRTREQALTSRQTKANEFEGTGGPEDKIDEAVRDRPGDDDVTANVR